MTIREAASKSLSYVFFDFEWSQYNLSVEEFRKLLEALENFSNKTKIIITIASRSKNFDINSKTGKATVNKLLDVISSYVDISGLNIVAGNPTYLSEDEKRKSTSRTLISLGEYIASRIDTKTDVFIGTEKILKTAAILARKFNFKPFLLLSNNIDAEIKYISKIVRNGETACYIPFSTTLKEEELIRKTWKYILRREHARNALMSANIDLKNLEEQLQKGQIKDLPTETKRIFVDVMKKFVVYGEGNGLKQSLNKLINKGINIIVGLPLSNSTGEITALAAWKNS